MKQSNREKTQTRSDMLQSYMETIIGYLLLGGVISSAVLITAGLAWHWLRTGYFGIEYTISMMNLYEFVLESVRLAAAHEFRPRLLVSLGIAALLLTPYLRVLVSLLFFSLVERNWKYSAFTGFVLLVLTYTLFLR